MTFDSDRLGAMARAVLKANDLGASTKPAPSLYPHQWNWDSCFIAIGISHDSTERAAQELFSLLRGQWRSGLVPQIVFNPKGTGYFPGPDVWQSERSPDAPRDVQTSGITEPPVLAISALSIWNNAEDKQQAREILRRLYPSLLHYHRFLYEQRNPDGDGLIVVIHPWESGLDNSPPYLDAGQRVHLAYKPQYERLDTLHVTAKNRPTNKDYDLYVYLLELMRAVDWNQKRYLETAPLQIKDVLFNSILCRADADLARIAEIVGEDPEEAHAWHQQTSAAINAVLWSEEHGAYYSYDRVAGRLLPIDTVAGIITLFGEVPTPARSTRVQEQLLESDAFWPEPGRPVPTTSMSSSWFNPINYWLGPVWVNTNWMTVRGLQRSGRPDIAQRLSDVTLGLVRDGGFREYYDPHTGEGYGTDNFSWSAALTIDLLAERAEMAAGS